MPNRNADRKAGRNGPAQNATRNNRGPRLPAGMLAAHWKTAPSRSPSLAGFPVLTSSTFPVHSAARRWAPTHEIRLQLTRRHAEPEVGRCAEPV